MRCIGLSTCCIYSVALSGALCQSFSSPDKICPGDDVTFNCTVVDTVGSVGTTTWRITPAGGGEPLCRLPHIDQRPSPMNCGPEGVFKLSFTSQTGGNFTSTLSVESISDSLTGTTVECEDSMAMDVGIEEICIIDITLLDYQSIDLDASISVPDLCDNTSCMVNVRWSEPFVSCGGSVSQYVLSVTPPTPDCQSGPGSEFVTDETHYNLTVTANQTYNLNISAINSCGDIGEPTEYIIDIGGVTTTCDYSYMYRITDQIIYAEGITITWQRIDVLNTEAYYRVVINEMVFNDQSMFSCSSDSCSYTFSPDGITSVAVEVVGCVTKRVECINTSSRCDPTDLKVNLPDCLRWRNLQSTAGYEFDGGNVTFSGIMNGSIATYTTYGDYLVNRQQLFQTTCQNSVWTNLPTIDITECPLKDLSPYLNEVNRVCRSVSGGVVCYSGDRVGSVAVYFCDDGYKLQGDSTRQCLSSGHWNGTTPLCIPDSCSNEPAVIVGVVCTLVFLSAGILLGALGLYLILRARGMLSIPPSPSLLPAATNEEVDVSREDASTQKIQLNTNEAYETIRTSPNTAYGQVQL